MDESDDKIFYDTPRLCYHIDDAAVAALTQFYKENFKDGEDVLDICSSWVSHYPKEWKGGNVVGLGMNDYELSKNPQLSSYVVKDLNEDPKFPFDDNSFDKVTCVVSVDYLNKPLEVFKEIGRVLRPGGECIISMSNRWYVVINSVGGRINKVVILTPMFSAFPPRLSRFGFRRMISSISLLPEASSISLGCLTPHLAWIARQTQADRTLCSS